MNSHWLVVALLYAVSCFGACRAGEVDVACIERIRSDAVARWRQADEDRIRNGIAYRGKYSNAVQFYDSTGKLTQMVLEHEFEVRHLLNRHCGSVLRFGRDRAESLDAINPDYRFEIRREESADWVLSKAGTTPASSHVYDNDFLWGLYGWHVDGLTSLANVIERNDVFRIDEAVFAKTEGGEISFDCQQQTCSH